MNKKKTIIIISMIASILLLGIVYAAFQTNLVINGTGSITGKWEIEVSNITYVPTGAAHNLAEPVYGGTNAIINTGLRKPGDRMDYTITVTNSGTVDAIVTNIDISTEGSGLIFYEVEGLQSQVRLKRSSSISFNISVMFDSSATSIPTNSGKELNIDIICVQDEGQTLTPITPEIEYATLVSQIMSDNTAYADNVASPYVTSSSGINFEASASDTNGKGLYYTSKNTEDGKTTYYFRGNVENNYVSFAGHLWRIVRINEDGSVRLITENTMSTMKFNSFANDNAYVGYMYGNVPSTSFANASASTNNSVVKAYLDSWYNDNLSNYSHLLADAGFCNDRSRPTSTALWVIYISQGIFSTSKLGWGTTLTAYGAVNRGYLTKVASFACPNSSDLFTTASSSKGNKSLINPIGLLSIDEAGYAGNTLNDVSDNSNYLDNNTAWWTMTPIAYAKTFAASAFVDANSRVFTDSVTDEYGVRPVINIKSNVLINGGNGSYDEPYAIKVN